MAPRSRPRTHPVLTQILRPLPPAGMFAAYRLIANGTYSSDKGAFQPGQASTLRRVAQPRPSRCCLLLTR